MIGVSSRTAARLTAVAGLAASLLGATVGVAAPAVAATPTQVALVVQYPDDDGLSPARKVWCVDYTSGMTGANVLAVAAPSYGSGVYAGFVLKVTSRGTTPPTTEKYWSYYRGDGSGPVSYSSTGVGGAQPAAGSVEVWQWKSSSAQPAPTVAPYAELCPNGYAADPAPSAAAPAPAAGGSTGGATGRAGASTGAGTPAAEGSAGSRTTGATGTPGDPTSPASDPSATSTTSASAPGSGAAAGSPGRTTSVAASDVAATTDTGGGTGRTLGLVVAGVAVLGLGGAAVVVRRRRAQAD